MQISHSETTTNDVSGGVLKVVHDDGREKSHPRLSAAEPRVLLPYYFILENENARLALCRAHEESLQGARVDWGLETLLL